MKQPSQQWYLADLILEHTIEDDSRNVVHVNTHLIHASSPDRATPPFRTAVATRSIVSSAVRLI